MANVAPGEEALPWYFQCDGELLRCKYPYNLKVGWPPEGKRSIALIQREAEQEGIRIHVRARGKEHTKVMLTITGPPGTTKAWYSRVRAGTKTLHLRAHLPSVHRVWIVPVSEGKLGPNQDLAPTGDTEESSSSCDVDEHETRPTAARVRKLGQYAGVVPEASDAGSKKEAAPFLVPESNLPSSPQARQEKRAGETRRTRKTPAVVLAIATGANSSARPRVSRSNWPNCQ
jgi:hypothetical protein